MSKRAKVTLHSEGYAPTEPTERQYVSSILRGWRGELPPLIYCHGSGDTTETFANKVGQLPLLNALSQHYFVVAADLGFQAWGNDDHLARIEDAVDYAAAMGATGPVTLVSVSMGTLGAMAYARDHSDTVAVASIIPSLNLAEAVPFAPAEINAAYGGTYDDAIDGPDHSPIQFAGDILNAVEVALFTSSDDPIVSPSSAAAFVAARPATTRVNLGALGHSEAAVLAAVNPVLAFLATT